MGILTCLKSINTKKNWYFYLIRAKPLIFSLIQVIFLKHINTKIDFLVYDNLTKLSDLEKI
jgi:hypothetical protein